MKNLILPFIIIVQLTACKTGTEPQPMENAADTTLPVRMPADTLSTELSTTAMMAMPEVPILCYHQIREWRGNESRGVKDMVVPPASFRSQMQLLADSGYQSVLPDDLYAYLTRGIPLPPKPIMLTFDDGDRDQYTVAAPELKRLGFKGVFFVMTVSLGRSIYMSKEDVKALADDGHVIAAHTWDHQNVKKYTGDDWEKQVAKPAQQLEAITGKPVQYFAYPFGAWNQQAIPELKKRNMKAAFQLSTVRDSTEPLYTIRRMIVPGDWSAPTMYRVMKKTFKS